MTGKKDNSKAREQPELLLAFISLGILWLATLAAVETVTAHKQNEIASVLTTIRDATYSAIKQWGDDHQRAAMQIAHNPRVAASTEALLQLPRKFESLDGISLN